MRRMMHAATILFAFSSFTNAQDNSLKDNSDNQSILIQAPIHEPNPPINDVPMDSPSLQLQQQVVPPSFLPAGCQRPYSPLGETMKCSDCSPNLWSGYASERAALAACISRHVDGQCDCFNGNNCLHAHASTPCGDGCASGCGIKRNRYKEPCSSLYSEPSIVASKKCFKGSGCGDRFSVRDPYSSLYAVASPGYGNPILGRKRCNGGIGCSEPTCSTCTGQSEYSAPNVPHSDSASKLNLPTRVALPAMQKSVEPTRDNLQAAHNQRAQTEHYRAQANQFQVRK